MLRFWTRERNPLGMSNSNPFLPQKPHSIWGYGAAVLSVAVAIAIAQWQVLHLGAAPVSLLLCAVMFSAWLGGAGPGLLATVLSALSFYYYFLPPEHSLVAKPEEIPRFILFIISALFVGTLSIAQRRATESLRRAGDKLKATVQELEKTNQALGKALEEIQALRDQLYKENLALR